MSDRPVSLAAVEDMLRKCGYHDLVPLLASVPTFAPATPVAPKSVEEMAVEMGYTKCAHPACEGYGNNTSECVSERTIIRLHAEHTAPTKPPREMLRADLSRVPAVLTVVLADTWVTECAIVHENEHRPYKRRTVHIELTDEQRAEMAPRDVGESRGKPVYEVVLTSWLEDLAPLRRVQA